VISEARMEAIVEKAVKDGMTTKQLELAFKPVTMGELMCRMFGIKAFSNIIDEAMDVNHIEWYHDNPYVTEAYTIMDKERIYLALKDRLYVTEFQTQHLGKTI